MSNPLTMAVSGMTAATRRLEISARNVANALSSGPSPQASTNVQQRFPAAVTPLRFSQVETAGGGPRAVVAAAVPAFALLYEPNAPYADDSGLIAAPNVDLMNEAIAQTIARYDFAANALVARSTAAMTKSLLDITA
jgi:flagellar basal-body rod protein FlgC